MDDIDILILNRNYGNFLTDAIESCLNQSYKKVNIIIADDNSTDNSRAIILKYSKHTNFKFYFIDDKNPNISKVRNFLVERSTSPYIAFLSSDDYFEETFLERSYNLLKNTAKNIGGIYFYFFR